MSGHGPVHDDHDHDHEHEHDHGHDHDHHHGHAHAHAHAHGHGHAHGHSHGAPATQSKLLWALVFTGGCMLLEAAGGLYAHSLALLADAAHMLTDSASLALSYAAMRAAMRPATAELSYGHHRWEVLAAFVNGLALIVLALWILASAAMRLLAGGTVDGKVVAGIALVGLAANVGAFLVLSRGESNLNVRGAIAHVVGDMLGSGAALVAGLVILWTAWAPVDPILSAVVAALMIRSGIAVARESAHILLEGTPPGLDPDVVEKALRERVPALDGIHHMHSWSLSDERPILTLHATLKRGSDSDQCIRDITGELQRAFRVSHATIQVEYESCDGPQH
jgi:cobalt-zinc-cadmium efflux system protein